MLVSDLEEEITFASLKANDDYILPFKIEALQIRGRLVRLGSVADTIIHKHAYPQPISELLGESLALTATLAGALKYEGVFTLQTKTDGAVKFLVSDLTSQGHMRGYCEFNQDALQQMIAEKDVSLPRLMGSGYLSFTVDQGENIERYQGIVELTGRKLVDCVHHYFEQSEQLQAGLKVGAGEVPKLGASRKHWRAGAIMLQRLPLEGGAKLQLDAEEQDDGWRRLMYLLGTCTTEELIDPYLTPQQLLLRLFHEDGVRVYREMPLVHQCRCSRSRIYNVLQSLSDEDLQDMQIDGKIIVTCQFCNSQYSFTPEEARVPPG